MPDHRQLRAKSAERSRATREALAQAQEVLERARARSFRALRQHPEVAPLLAQLREDAALLAQAPALRIGAARRVQGVSSRRKTAARVLFEACAEARRRVKMAYRGPRHAALRTAVGEGLAASAEKPQTVLQFAERVIAAWAAHPAALYAVRVRQPTIDRIADLRAALAEMDPERQQLRAKRRETRQSLAAVAARVWRTCAAIEEKAEDLRAAAAADGASAGPPAGEEDARV